MAWVAVKRSLRAVPAAAALSILAAPAAHAAGMPQLDFANPLTRWQVLWGALIFAVLYLALSRSALPRVGAVLADRQSRIDSDLEAARQAKSDSDRAIDELQRARRAAAAEAQANLDRVLNEARDAAAKRMHEMNMRLDAELAAAEARIANERQLAMASLRGIAADAAALLVERVTGHAADRAVVDARVDAICSARGDT